MDFWKLRCISYRSLVVQRLLPFQSQRSLSLFVGQRRKLVATLARRLLFSDEDGNENIFWRLIHCLITLILRNTKTFCCYCIIIITAAVNKCSLLFILWLLFYHYSLSTVTAVTITIRIIVIATITTKPGCQLSPVSCSSAEHLF